MMARGYTLDLYCDDERHCNHRDGPFPDEYVGETFGECAGAARRNGWRINRRTGIVVCPKHSGKRKPTPKTTDNGTKE
jgi:hypothetical protein